MMAYKWVNLVTGIDTIISTVSITVKRNRYQGQ